MSDAAPHLAAPAPQADFSDCAREPIQFLGGVQSFGCLLVLSSDWIVQNASANCAAVLGLAPEVLVGTRLTDHLPPEAVHLLRGKVQILGRGDEGTPAFGAALFGDGRHYDIAIHRSEGLFLFEFEPAKPNRKTYDPSVIGALLARVQAVAGDTDAMCDLAVNGIWAMTGFDRVMMYRFEPDYSGVVVAEALGAGAGSYMGQRFPASDIPPQARALYTRNLHRIIADVDAPVHPLVPAAGRDGQPVDLSLAVTRAVSPVHLQYLRNMGVAASMSVSILRDGRLWGMVACHHPRPHYVDYETRLAVEMFCRLLSYELALADGRAEAAQTEAAYDLHEKMAMLSIGAEPDLGLLAREIGGVIGLDGIAMMAAGRYETTGLAPTPEEFERLVQALARSGEGRIFATDEVERACPGAVAPERGIGGFLAIPLRRAPAEYVLLLRHEVTRNLVWAGPPDKSLSADGAISPRRSFAAWQEAVRGHCRAWGTGDLRAAEVLRVTLLELALRQSTERGGRDQLRSQRQEVLIAELNHRLRNVFGLVTGLVHQATQEAPAGVAAFAQEMAGRIAALARANDLLTQTAGPQAAPDLRRLIRDEAGAYGGTGGGRVRLHGVNAVLRPQAQTTMALVLHELVTNAAKYGALSQPGGLVDVCLTEAPDGGLRLAWTESGGPQVSTPRRMGFGSTLLGRAVPYELGGEAEVAHPPTGLTARFTIPQRHVQAILAAGDEATVPKAASVAAVRRFTGRGLVVEDNLLIAMNAAEALRALGAADVVVVGNIDAALDRIAAEQFDLAILDLDLGGTLSTPVAEALRGAGVPFLLATGYDEAAGDEPAALRGAPRLKKPYSNDAIAQALAGAKLLG